MNRKKGKMSLGHYKKLIDSLQRLKNLSIITYGGWGEPTLHPNLREMIEYTKDKGLYNVTMTTNGSKFNNPDYILDLFRSGIDKIMISFRITEENKHKSNLPSNLNYQVYIDSLLQLVELKYKHQFKTQIQFSIFKDSFYSKYFLKKNANDFINKEPLNNLLDGISKITKKSIPSYDEMNKSFLMKLTNATTFKVDQDIFIELDSLSHITSFFEKYLNPKNCKLAKYGSCLGLYNHFIIYWSGIVSTCCADVNAGNNLGNVFEDDIVDILSNKKSMWINENLRNHKMPTHTCKLCRGGISHLEKWGIYLGNLVFYNRFMIKKIAAEDWIFDGRVRNNTSKEMDSSIEKGFGTADII